MMHSEPMGAWDHLGTRTKAHRGTSNLRVLTGREALCFGRVPTQSSRSTLEGSGLIPTRRPRSCLSQR